MPFSRHTSLQLCLRNQLKKPYLQHWYSILFTVKIGVLMYESDNHVQKYYSIYLVGNDDVSNVSHSISHFKSHDSSRKTILCIFG